MNLQEVLTQLQAFGFPVKEYRGTVELEMEPRTKINEITREEVRAALAYKLSIDRIRQIDPWTIVITF